MTRLREVLRELGRNAEHDAVGAAMSAFIDERVAEIGVAPEVDAAQTYEAFLALLEFRRSEGKGLDAAEWTLFLDAHERHVDDMVERAVDSESTRWLAHRLQVYTAMADRRTELPRLWAKYEHLSRRTPAPTWIAGSLLTDWADVVQEVEYLRSLALGGNRQLIEDRLRILVEDVLTEVAGDRSEILSRIRHLLLICRESPRTGTHCRTRIPWRRKRHDCGAGSSARHVSSARRTPRPWASRRASTSRCSRGPVRCCRASPWATTRTPPRRSSGWPASWNGPTVLSPR